MTFAHEEEIFPTSEAPDPFVPEESNVSNEKAKTESEKKRKSPEKPTEKKVSLPCFFLLSIIIIIVSLILR